MGCCPEDKCGCNYRVYKVRPYAYNFLRGLKPFFEMIAFSKLSKKVLSQLVTHMESVLFKHKQGI
jgi:hypothetical protein